MGVEYVTKDRGMNMGAFELEHEIDKLIEMKQEGGYWDFKREWYHSNADLLHDIICMANNLLGRDAYIILGVDESKDYEVVGITEDSNRKNTQKIVDFLRNKKFAGVRPTVYVQTINLQGKALDVLIVKNDYNTPYYLTEKYEGVFANNIYVRVMDTNTPKDSSADRVNVEYLWKKHFRLDVSPIERVLYYLTERENWINAHSGTSSIEYYEFFPEFTIKHISARDERDGYEHYLFNQTDTTPHWYDINIRFHQTIIASLGGVALDGGRYFTSTPNSGGISTNPEKPNGWDIYYKYFIKGTLDYAVHCYYYKNDNSEARISHDRFLECVLVFDSEQEKEAFEAYVFLHQDQLAEFASNIHLPYFPNLPNYNMGVFKERYANGCALNKMLKSFRDAN